MLLVAIVPVQSLPSPSFQSDLSTQFVCKLNTYSDAVVGAGTRTDEAPCTGAPTGLELKQMCRF